jgi:hypothetical protein
VAGIEAGVQYRNGLTAAGVAQVPDFVGLGEDGVVSIDRTRDILGDVDDERVAQEPGELWRRDERG